MSKLKNSNKKKYISKTQSHVLFVLAMQHLRRKGNRNLYLIRSYLSALPPFSLSAQCARFTSHSNFQIEEDVSDCLTMHEMAIENSY